MEIERKFLLPKMIDHLPLIKQAFIEQRYLLVSDDMELRIRMQQDYKGVSYKITAKSSGGIARQEIETDVDSETYYKFLKLSSKHPIEKQYMVFDYDGTEIECSIVDENRDTGFMYAEIEFDSVEDANAFVAPDWLGIEVTHDDTYKMKNYWKRTRLKL